MPSIKDKKIAHKKVSYVKAACHGLLTMATGGMMGGGIYAASSWAPSWLASTTLPSALTWTVANAPMALAVISSPPVLMGLAAAGTVGVIGSLVHQYSFSKEEDNSAGEQSIDVISKKIKEQLKGGVQSLNISNVSFELVSAMTLLISVAKVGPDDEPTLILDEIKISTRSFSHNFLNELLSAGLGQFGTKRLEITNSILSNKLPQALWLKMKQEHFNVLEELDLSRNEIDVQGLPVLSKIGKISKIKTLDLSGNSLVPTIGNNDIKELEAFFKDFHKNFPTVKKLIIQNVNLTGDSLHYLKPLFSNPGFLTEIDISKNPINAREFEAFLKEPEIQNNINVRKIITGYKSKNITKISNQRKNRLKKLEECLQPKADVPIVLSLLESLASDAKKENATRGLKTYVDGVETNEIQGWCLLAKLFAKHKESERVDDDTSVESAFIEFKRHFKSNDVYVSSQLFETLVKSRDGDDVDLVLSVQDTQSVEKIVVDLTRTLEILSENNQHLNIPSIILKDFKLDDDKFTQLLDAGIGRYNTKELSFANNGLDDMACLALKEDAQFMGLKILDLSHNKITTHGLKVLAEFCKAVGIEQLDLSGNPLAPRSQAQMAQWGEFCKTLHKAIPTLKTLKLNDIGLKKDAIQGLRYIFQESSLLQNLEIRGNEKVAETLKLLTSDEVKNNITIRNVSTEIAEKRNKVRAELTGRTQQLSVLYNTLGLVDDESITLALLKKLSGVERDNTINQLENVMDEQEIRKWKLFSDGFLAYKASLAVDARELSEEAMFLAFKNDNKTNCEHIFDAKLKTLVDSDNGINIDLAIGGVGSLRPAYIKTALQKGLEALYNKDNRPVIENLSLVGIKLTSTEFQNLMESGLGDYGTKSLNLSANNLDDNAALHLANYQQFGKLKTLDLSKNKLTAGSLQSVVQFCAQAEIESLDISDNALAPRNEAEKQAFTNFCQNIQKQVPTLKTLKLSDIGLTSQTMLLVRPLLHNKSQLTELDISQKAKLAPKYEMLIKSPEFQSNLCLTKLSIGSSQTTGIRKQLRTKKQLFDAMVGNLIIDGVTVYEGLLKKFIRLSTPELPDAVNRALDKNISGDFSFRQVLQMEARRLQYFRDRVALRDTTYQFTDATFAEETTALKKNKLSDFWAEKTKNNPLEVVGEVQVIKNRHARVFLEESGLKACEILKYDKNGVNFSVFFAADDTIRVVNSEDKKQLIFPRYESALALNGNGVFHAMTVGGFYIDINRKGDVTLGEGGCTIAKINGNSIELSADNSQVIIQGFSFYRTQRVADFSALCGLPPSANREQSSSARLLPQYQQQQQNTRRVSSSSSSSTSANDATNALSFPSLAREKS